MRICHASIDERGKAKGGTAGDQTGKEVCVRTYYDKGWQYLLRYSEKAEQMAQAAEWLAKSNLVGYDQNQRNSLNTELSKISYQYKLLKTPCETDCSAFMTVCAWCAGIRVHYLAGNAPTTSNMVNQFRDAGFTVFSKPSMAMMKRGDILVAPGKHTVMVLDDYVSAFQKPVLKIGSKGDMVIYLQQRLVSKGYDIGRSGVDGDFGQNTYKAVRIFQQDHGLVVDGIVGVKTWNALEKG